MLDSEGLELYDQPLSSSLGIQAQLPILLSEYVFYSKQDVEDYLSLLSSIDTYYDSIIAFEKEKPMPVWGCATRSSTVSLIPATPIFWTRTTASWRKHLRSVWSRWRD